MSALEKANHMMEHGCGYQPSVGCSCGGYWWTENGSLVAATHAPECPHAESSAPAAARSGGEQPE